MITIYVHQPGGNPLNNGTAAPSLDKGMQEIALEDIEQIKSGVETGLITFILPINRRNYLVKNLNLWIYNFLLVLENQQDAIAVKASKGDPGKDGKTPTEAEITAAIQKVMPKVPVIRSKRVELKNIALGLKEIPVMWDAPFDSANYTVVCTIEATAGALVQLDSVAATGKTKTGFTVRVKNISLGAASCFLHCIAVAD